MMTDEEIDRLEKSYPVFRPSEKGVKQLISDWRELKAENEKLLEAINADVFLKNQLRKEIEKLRKALEQLDKEKK